MSHRFMQYNLVDELEKLLETTDFEEIGLKLLSNDGSTIDASLLRQYIEVLNFIEYETELPTVVSDDTYDKIVAKYKDLSGTSIIGTHNNSQSNTRLFAHHRYPELRGSLDKIHFLKNEEIPDNDSRKSLEYFIHGILRDLSRKNLVQPINIPILVDFKWDGVSHVFEMCGTTIDKVLTRYDVDNNIGVDITHIFSENSLDDLCFTKLPKNIKTISKFGLKVETFMPTEFFRDYIRDMGDKKCNRRSAITSIVNQARDQFDPSLTKYLAVKPLQISSEEYFDIEGSDSGWFYIGKLNDRYQYIHIYTPELMFTVKSLSDFVENLDTYPIKETIDSVKNIAEDVIPVDGAVITILDSGIIKELGRSQDTNKFQIAFKFPQGQKKTTLKDVEFPVGPVAGSVTPLAIVDPVTINGNTITNASLSNFDKLDRLDLNIGDEVIVVYDIIPKLIKDASCRKGTGKKITRLETCPVCGSDLKGGCRCLNPNCDAKLSGKIRNYIKKMKIKKIGTKTVEKFVDLGFLTCIGDLYRLPVNKMMNLPGFDVVSCSNIVSSIFGRTKVYPHEFLGALGIPDISTEIMKKLCKNMDVIHMGAVELQNSLPRMMEINGIGEITGSKIISGIIDRLGDIDDIIGYLEFLEYPKTEVEYKDVVLFTECRDYDFAEYLEDHNVKVSKNYIKSLTYLIVPDDMIVESSSNAKVVRARKEDVQIITLSDAKDTFGYI